MSSTPYCPILSIRNTNTMEICLEGNCALYLPNAKKCSLVYIGFKAMVDVQKLQAQQGTASASQQ
jgi:hypothetical protein